MKRNIENEDSPLVKTYGTGVSASTLTKKEELASQFIHTLMKANPISKFSAPCDYGEAIGRMALRAAETILGDDEE